MVMVIDPFFWFLMRLVTGICFASLFANVESWINAQVTNNNRARTLAIYRFVDLGAVTLSQYMLPVFGIGGFEIFAVMTMLIILSIVPVSLADRSNPAPPAPFSFNPKRLFAVSPLACAGADHRRADHRLVPLGRPALCGGPGFWGVRYRLVHERGHHRRDRAAISAGLSVRQHQPPVGAADGHGRLDPDGAGDGLVRRQQPGAQPDRDLPVGCVHAAALLAVGGACQRQGGGRRICADRLGPDVLLGDRRVHRPAALGGSGGLVRRGRVLHLCLRHAWRVRGLHHRADRPRRSPTSRTGDASRSLLRTSPVFARMATQSANSKHRRQGCRSKMAIRHKTNRKIPVKCQIWT
jgi:hypothetical protein